MTNCYVTVRLGPCDCVLESTGVPVRIVYRTLDLLDWKWTLREPVNGHNFEQTLR